MSTHIGKKFGKEPVTTPAPAETPEPAEKPKKVIKRRPKKTSK